MGKAGRNEMKRVAANFLNGVAVALLMAGYTGALLAGDERAWLLPLGLVAGGAVHWMAVRLAGEPED